MRRHTSVIKENHLQAYIPEYKPSGECMGSKAHAWDIFKRALATEAAMNAIWQKTESEKASGSGHTGRYALSLARKYTRALAK
jgi:hypothetical protein